MRRILAVLLGAALVVSGATPAWAADEPLAVTSTGLTDGQWVGMQRSVWPTWTGDATTVEWVVAGRLSRTDAAKVRAGGLRLMFKSLEDGTDQDLTVRVRNAAGETAEATTHIRVDIHALPVKPIVFSPAVGTVVRGPVRVTISGLPDDITEITLSTFPVGDTPPFLRLTSAPWAFTIDPAVHSSFGVTITDRARNVAFEPVGYGLDNIGPDVSATLFPPVGAPVGYARDVANTGEQWVYVTVYDNSPVARVEFHAEGHVVPVTHPQFLYDFGDKTRTVKAEFRAWDNVGNMRVTPYTVRVDNQAPVVTRMTPAGGILVRGSRVSSAITAADTIGIRSATLVGAPADGSPPYAASIPAGKDGRLMLRWLVTDWFMHTAQFTRFVTVDNTKPSLRIASAPANGAKVTGAVRVVAVPSDRNGINRVELIINGKIVSAGMGTFSINTAKYGKTLKVQFRAWDRAGNWSVTPVRTWKR